MEKVQKGDRVRVHYTGRLKDGKVFDSSKGREPLEFEVGAGMMIAGFDRAVNGMAVGEQKTVEIPSSIEISSVAPSPVRSRRKSAARMPE